MAPACWRPSRPEPRWDEINIGTYLSDDAVSLVLVTGDKLNDILNSALAQMLDSDSEQYGISRSSAACG